MKNKKMIALIFVSICVFSRVNGMEFVKDVVKNEVLPAALIMGTGAALGAIHNSLSWQIYEGRSFDWKKNAKEGAKSGALWALPVVGSTLLGSRSSRLDFSIKNCIALGGIGCLPFCLSAILSWSHKNVAGFNMAIAQSLQTQPRTDLEERVIKGHGKATEQKIFFANGAACTLLSVAIIARRIKEAL